MVVSGRKEVMCDIISPDSGEGEKRRGVNGGKPVCNSPLLRSGCKELKN